MYAIGAGDLARPLAAIGVRRGQTLLVRTAFSRVGPVDGGPRALIDALRDAIGDDGALVTPSMPDDDRPFDPRRRTVPRHGRGGRHLLAAARRAEEPGGGRCYATGGGSVFPAATPASPRGGRRRRRRHKRGPAK